MQDDNFNFYIASCIRYNYTPITPRHNYTYSLFDKCIFFSSLALNPIIFAKLRETKGISTDNRQTGIYALITPLFSRNIFYMHIFNSLPEADIDEAFAQDR